MNEKDMKQVIRYPDAVWNISGLFVHDAAVLFFYDLMKECGIRVDMMVHGNIPCQWNSGRIIQSVEKDYQEWCLKEYERRNIPVLLTFSNYMLERDDLEDTLSNEILDRIAKTAGSGVIVASDMLLSYIRDKYPNLVLYSSILKVVSEDRKGDIEYYRSLLSSFDRVVLHPDDGLDFSLLERLESRNRYEILLNENCVRDCRFRKEHCDIVSQYYKDRRPADGISRLNDFKLRKCKSTQSVKVLEEYIWGMRKTCNATEDELKQMYELGYRFFKIQGRSLSTASLLFDFLGYLLMKDAYIAVYKMIMDRMGSKSIYEMRDNLMVDSRPWASI